MPSPPPIAPRAANRNSAPATPPWRPLEIGYAVLLIAGTALPLSRFLPWLSDHGLNLPLFVTELFANRISAFFAWDVVISVLTLLVVAVADRDRLPRGQWLLVGAASLLGASVGLPLYLLLRERRRRSATT